jgi:HD-GYP domain-containing protein (c-di-GMP phosphodiesterase class II)
VTRLSDLVRDQAPDSKSGETLPPQTGDSPFDTDRCWFLEARQELWQVRDAVRAGNAPQLKGCVDLSRQLVQRLRRSDDLVRWALDGQTEDYLGDNALHVAVLGTKVGMGLHYSEQDLERLALVGLLHDIGMWTLPVSLVEKRGTFSEEERDILRTHPERGRRILAGQGSVFEWVSTISAQEHERSDGSGYPCRLKGKQIAEPAQIIGIVDTLDAMVTVRPYRNSVVPHLAIRDLLLNAKTTFALRVLKGLGDHITLYPLGTRVRLNTGEIGMVMRTNSRYPLRPVVTISKIGEVREMDLSQSMASYIVEVLQPSAAS